jgi:para-aminobenzoate synthetase component 1
MKSKKINWQEPLELAEKIATNYIEESWCFLYSGLSDKVKNSNSYIALFPQEKIVTDNFSEAQNVLKNNEEKWFGYLSYELAQDFEKLPKSEKSFIDLPKIQLIKFAIILEFNHDKKILTAFFSDEKKYLELSKWTPQQVRGDKFRVRGPLESNFSDKSYITAINNIKKMIADGDFYQTNLTRKFFGKFTKKLDHQQNFQLFKKLTELSPANYSSFLKLGKNYIISASPELFFSIKNNKILSRPIKGTAPRSSDEKQDKENKLNLKNSTKERAENLMIVDLVRNDLARICKAGSVKVKKLFTINSYQNVHHMSSEIHGEILPNQTALKAISALFPPGSMTGAPKIKAMEIAAKKERINRGIYSGAIGYLSGSEANFSVVIRTLILQENKFEFQSGGAITFDSDAKSELQEIFSKAKAIKNLLGVNF